ncbi:acyl-CoA dehydrogenase, partial [Pseudomonas aeruginosa]|nr:acyl-CoA dehydrogenase [Pseudomonas aeruginosa]
MLDPTLSDWLDRQADALDRGDAAAAARLARPGPPRGRG